MKPTAEPGTMLDHHSRVLLREAQSTERACDECANFEKGGYCLLHGQSVKNADIVTCSFNQEAES